jgi:hypothetical protein
VLSGDLELETAPRQPPAPAPAPQAFVVRKRAGGGPLADGDEVVLETVAGRPLAVDFATGRVFVSAASGGGAAAVFQLSLLPP